MLCVLLLPRPFCSMYSACCSCCCCCSSCSRRRLAKRCTSTMMTLRLLLRDDPHPENMCANKACSTGVVLKCSTNGLAICRGH